MQFTQNLSSSQQTTVSMPRVAKVARRSVARVKVSPTAMASYQNLRAATPAEVGTAKQLLSDLAKKSPNCLVCLNHHYRVDSNNNAFPTQDLHLVGSAGSFSNGATLKLQLNRLCSRARL